MRCEPMALNGASNANDKLLCQHSVSCFKRDIFFIFIQNVNQHFCREAEESKPHSKNTK